MALPNARFSIDWDDDGFFNKETQVGDLLNLIPKPLFLSTVDITPDPGCKITRKNAPSLYGVNAWELAAESSPVILYEHQDVTGVFRLASGQLTGTTITADSTGTSLQALGDTGGSNVRLAQLFNFGSNQNSVISFDVFFDASVNSPTEDVVWEIRTDNGSGSPGELTLAKGRLTPTPSQLNTVTVPDFIATSWPAGSGWLVLSVARREYGRYYQVRYNTTGGGATNRLKTDTNGAATWGGLGGTNRLRSAATSRSIHSHMSTAQSFTTTEDFVIDKIIIPMYQSVVNANITVRIETDSSGNPSGTLVHANAEKVVALSVGSTFLTDIEFDFTDFTLTAGTYWIAVSSDQNSLTVGRGDYNAGFPGTLKYFDLSGMSWITINASLVFSLYGFPDEKVQGYFGRDTSGVADDIAVSASTQYTLSFWSRGISGFAGQTARLTAKKQDGTDIANTGDFSLDAGGDWTRRDLTFTTPSGTTHVSLFVEGSVETMVFQVTGFMLVAGAMAPTGFNVGTTLSLYDNITDTTESAQWELGRAKPEDVMFAEGTARITLDNLDKRYSPEYASSPLFGYIRPNLRFQIELQRPSTDDYEIVWTGWTSPIQPETSEYGTVQAHLECTQGKFRLDNVPLRYAIELNQRSDQIIDGIIKGGWFTAATPFVTVLDRSRLDENTYMHDLDDVRTTEAGASVFSFAGENWRTGETPSSTAISDIMKVERGYTWIDRTGKFVFRNRHYYAVNPTVDEIISADTQTNGAEYHYGDQIRNEVKVTYYPKEVQDDIVVWNSKETITLKRGETKTITAKFEYEEGSKLTVTNVNDFDAPSNPSVLNATNAIGADLSNLVSAKITLKNGEADIELKNNSKFLVTVTITLKGDSILSSGSTAITVSDVESVQEHGLYEHPAVSAKDVVDLETAEDLGNFLVARFKEPFGTFDSITIMPRNETWMERILDVSIGKLISLSETQTGAANKRLVVVGESMSWTPNNLKADYVLVRPEIPSPWVLGVSKLGTETYLGY